MLSNTYMRPVVAFSTSISGHNGLYNLSGKLRPSTPVFLTSSSPPLREKIQNEDDANPADALRLFLDMANHGDASEPHDTHRGKQRRGGSISLGRGAAW